ncbi:hypothetical protein PDJAM_G00005970 [Pangasius djambal]|uniref:Uncharacterized protein n=1 Tax=Pangasius djambal TaxID=1691987 RepID=A0ACC5XZ62_9TELE|nr:hypothetical protein [Pangasius djambal]
MDNFRNLEDETFPSFLSNTSLGSSGRLTLGDVTLGSTLGVPMAVSTVAKSRATADNRLTDVQASYLEPGPLSLAGSQGSGFRREKFALSFKDDLDNAHDFIAANRFSDLLVKVNLDESECVSTPKASAAVDVGAPSASARPSNYPDDISTGLLTVSHIGGKETNAGQAVLAPIAIEEGPESEAVDSDGMSGSVASFLANEKLMSLDSMNSDVTDDDIGVDNLDDEELQLYFSKLVPPGMQRGRVEGQEIPAAELPDSQVGSSQSVVPEPDTSPKNRCNFLNDYDNGDFCMPDVRLAATGMDSCPASDEDTEDELEASQNRSRARFLLPSTSRQLVGESHQPHFRPGLEGGSSDDESQPGAQFTNSRTGIEHRCSAEGQVIDLPITGDGGGGDGSSGSEEDGNDGGVSTVPPLNGIQTTYDVLRGLGIVGGSGIGEDEHQLLSQLPGLGRFVSNVHSQMGDRVGPVGTVETESSVQSSGLTRLQSINQSINQDRQEALNAMESSHSGAVSLEERFDSMYLRPGGVCNQQDSTSDASAIQGTQNAFDFSFTKNPLGESKAGVDQGHTIDFSDLSLCGGPCRNSVTPGQHPHNSEEHSGDSLEVKYLSQTLHQSEVQQSNIWNQVSRPDDVELEFQQGANATHSVVYQNEDGKWVTDLAYYSSFEKETNIPDIVNQFQSEEFVGGGQAMEKIIEDQEEFEKEHKFMQEEQIEAVSRSVLLSDTSWKLPSSSHILMRASQVSSEFENGNQSYLRISLGEFFQQRSEALGCLGGSEENIKRPSFGYIINSPEKREPFALIRPSDFSSRGSSVHSETVQLSDADETMNPEDLEKTLEPTPAEQPQKGHAHPKDVQISPVLSLDNKENSTKSSESNSSGSLTLSISTIASAIADASISSDPAQLAAMIMELSKMRHSKSRRTDELVQTPVPGKLPEQDELQKTLSLGDLSALDMEKYLKKAEVSSSDSDASSSQSCLDILSLADSLANSGRPSQRQTPSLPNASPERCASGDVVASHCTFRPSTSPLTHSSPSQTSLPSGYGDLSPSSSSGMCERSPGTDPLSPQSHCCSPSISRLTYLSINENTTLPTPNHHQKNNSMSLSTTIIRASPTPPIEPVDANKPIHQTHNGDLSSQSSCLTETSGPNQQTSEHGSHIQNECNIHKDYRHECGSVNRQSESHPSLYAQVDSGYSSNLNINNQPGGPMEQNTNQVPNIAGAGSEAFLGSQYGPPPTSYKSEPLRYGLAPNSQGALPDLNCGVPTLLTGRSLFHSSGTQLPQQYLSAEGSLQASSYHIGPLAGLYGVPAVMTGANPQIAHTHVPGATGLSSVYMTAGQHPHHYPLSKPYGQPSMGAWSARDLADLKTQVVVPDELKFPGACCVGIACQTSLSIFNPSERWQQVAISIVNLSIDGAKVDSLPYQWLIVKNKTIIGPKSTEEQKVLLIAPKAGLYQCTLSVSSWPASAESETVAQAEAFAKKVVLIAVAENPAIEVDVGKTDCLDFGDLAGGSVKSLPLKLVNRTRATVPIRLVISANASAWHCFSFSKSPVTMTADGSLHSGGNLSSISVINHVMHSSCGDNPDSFMVWVHFNAPQRFSAKLGELGPPDEFSARVDIEVDNPGPSRVIQSVALRARSGTARVHAPKDLQTVCLQSPLGQSASQTLPLKNAGNIDVQLRLKSNDGDSCFTVNPEELFLRTGEERGVVVTFTAQSNKKYKECLLTILVLPSGPQYEVVLKGEVVQGSSGNVTSAQVLVAHGEVPPILSNKQFMAWGGVTLGRAVQQKLVLRNNSPTSSQQLRLLIRGQDQDCFQLQSSFGPDERLTRSRELLIKPKEDVAVHLLFAPTRVASMLAKLEIKQSAVRPSQPGVKFTIPLSGYGGTSNVILEELRKRSDGYVATLSGIQAGRVSKLCVCVRNTGSRAAFIRAVPYSDLEKRTVMDSTVISLSPSQFILKERTQEVITVVMKASCREQALCQSHTAPLATICLFCGDEVSRQQFRKLLHIKPDVGRKVLSENSLLKSISFDEPFLGEEFVQEAYDLPQRPNEAQIFYGNMSKVILSLLGTVEASDSGESEHIEFVRASQHHATDSDSGLGTSERHFSNVSLDVLPVKGPPLCASGPVLKRTESSVDNTWSVQPEQLVLTAPTITGAADTKHVRILNCSDRELRFELSWPAHCLTITPQHGIIEPQSHLQILISPNPSLATKSSMLPWSGQIYVQCDNQQKFIRVQIRQDLAMDNSASGSSSDRSLCPLPPQAETPVGSGLKAQCASPQTSVEIKNRTVVFPSTCSGESSECSVEVENHGEEVRWYLSSFAPPYVKGVDGSGDVYRATYTAFRCERMSGMLGVKEKMQVPFTFLPRDGGDYAQFWDLECHPVTKPQQKSRIRFQLCGTGMRAGAGMSRKDCALVRTDVNVKSRKRVESAGSKSGMESSRRGVYAPQSLYMFPATRVGEVSTLKVNFRNNSCNTHELRFLSPSEPFYIKHSKYSLRTQHYINLPVQFKPTTVGQFSGLLQVQTDTDVKLAIELSGEALP